MLFGINKIYISPAFYCHEKSFFICKNGPEIIEVHHKKKINE
jgi:hypothetical protein